MKYEMLSRATVKRITDTFYSYSYCINEHYASFRKEHEEWMSDRDRLVGRMAKKFIGKYFVLADKEIIAESYENCVFAVEHESVYSKKPDYHINQGKPIIRTIRKYLHIVNVRSENEMYGKGGYICLECYDTFDNLVKIRCDYNNLVSLQFREITKQDFDAVVSVFEDDRDPIDFKVTRYMDYDEMKAKFPKRKRFDHLMKETVVVKAKDAHDAYSSVKNAIEVELA